MSQSLFRRVPGNLLILIFLFFFLLFFYYPHTRPFSQLDTSALALYLNGTLPMQALGSLASELNLECEPVLQSVFATEISTVTAIRNLTVTSTATVTETQTCPAMPEATPSQITLPAKPSAQEATPEQQVVARLRAQGIVIIFKTGAQEVSHLSIQVGTTLRYLDPRDILFFSDLQGSLGPFMINDALRNVNQSIKETHKDFDIYRDIRKYQRTGQDIEELKEERKKGDGRSGWRLDKYKFLHMVEESFEMRPDAKWYVFIETDSYVIWDNLATWLSMLDPKKAIYLGAPVSVGGTAFGHGGSGYVLSNAAMNRLLGPDQPQGLAATWDLKMKHVCCGDLALGLALIDKGVRVRSARPLLNGEKPATLSYGPGEHWCHPVVTMHHVQPHEVSAMWRYERRKDILDVNRNASATMFADLYFHFVEPHMITERDNWDNMSHGTTYSEAELGKIAKEKGVEDEKKHKEETVKKEKDAAEKEIQQKAEAHKNEQLKEENKRKGNGTSESDEKVEQKSEPRNLDEQKSDESKPDKQAPKETMPEEKSQRQKEEDKKANDSKPENQNSDNKPTPKSDQKPIDKAPPRRQAKRREPLTDVEKVAHLSFENCGKACDAKPQCYQYVHHDKECKLGHSFRLGKFMPPGDGGKVLWRSAWKVEKIRKWTEANFCEEPDWPDQD